MAERGSRDETRPITSTRRTEWRAVPADGRPSVDLLAWAGWIIGGELIVVALVALARAGFDDFRLFEPVVAVGPFQLTRLFALITLVVGGIIWAGVAGTPDDIGLRVLGAIMLVVGIVWIIEPGGFNRWLGTESSDGVHWAVLGAVLVGLSLVQPFRVGRRPADPPA